MKYVFQHASQRVKQIFIFTTHDLHTYNVHAMLWTMLLTMKRAGSTTEPHHRFKFLLRLTWPYTLDTSKVPDAEKVVKSIGALNYDTLISSVLSGTELFSSEWTSIMAVSLCCFLPQDFEKNVP